ncbi:hypothetical protein SAMN05880582_103206 [Rhizobium sp. RU20A]|uniref:hypothetical protein n=1 Tax=Rhizobium sp. RU20A TaxID=1907412 RepID=UPI000956CBDD|nr:hypothetical protein [Rhizobium sp. RU20A]SIQ74670.1 hypothetical protein SAMN05880582_103206 [Rhizobium sp. RU20A]
MRIQYFIIAALSCLLFWSWLFQTVDQLVAGHDAPNPETSRGKRVVELSVRTV